MSKRVTIGSHTYDLPLQGENPSWGEEISDIIEALIDSSNNTNGPYDILTTSALIANDVSSATNINLFKLNTATVRSFESQYYVFRKNDSTTISEAGIIIGINDDTLGWSISISSNSDAGITFDIDSTGQITYTSTDMGGVYDSSNSKIQFKAIALSKS